MSENPGHIYPSVSAAGMTQSTTPSEELATNEAWAAYYRSMQQQQQQSSLLSQYYPTQVTNSTTMYYPYNNVQEYYAAVAAAAATGVQQTMTNTNQNYQSYYQYGYQQQQQQQQPQPHQTPQSTTGLTMNVVSAKDPSPPGNDNVEIPGLGIKKAQTEFNQEEFIPPLPVEEPPTSIGLTQPLSNEDKFQTYLLQTQMIAQNALNAQKGKEELTQQTRATPVITPGFQFRPNGSSTNNGIQTTMVNLTNQKDPVPFLIKPAMSKKLQQQSTPSYIVVKPQKPTINQSNRVHPFADKIEQLFSNASSNQMDSNKQTNAKTLEYLAYSSPKVSQEPEGVSSQSLFHQTKTDSKKALATLDVSTQRKRRKFETAPKKDLEIGTPYEELKKQERGLRFSQSTPVITSSSLKPEPKAKAKLVGECQELEKSYFRLSGRPDPSVVRPESVLELALDRLVHLLKTQQVEYFYVLDQFKGMRQDCTVQQLQSSVSVRIYEASARAHLEYGEMWEYNQCQSNLETLYKQGVTGCRSEFLAYRILYQVFHIKKGEAILLNKTLRSLTNEDRMEAEVSHALKMVSALMTNNLRELFRLYIKAPNLGRALIDHVLEEIRFKATKFFIKSIRLKEPVESMIEELGFYSDMIALDNESTTSEIPPGCMHAIYQGKANIQNDKSIACEYCVEWLRAHGAVLIEDERKGPLGTLIDPVASRTKLFIPKAENAVAHGDPNLNMSYFLVK
eukprot:g5993.t1